MIKKKHTEPYQRFNYKERLVRNKQKRKNKHKRQISERENERTTKTQRKRTVSRCEREKARALGSESEQNEREANTHTQTFYASSICNCFLPGQGKRKNIRTLDTLAEFDQQSERTSLEATSRRPQRERGKGREQCHLNRHTPNVFANRRAATDATHSSVYFAHTHKHKNKRQYSLIHVHAY